MDIYVYMLAATLYFGLTSVFRSLNFYGFITVSDTVLGMGDMEGDSK